MHTPGKTEPANAAPKSNPPTAELAAHAAARPQASSPLPCHAPPSASLWQTVAAAISKNRPLQATHAAAKLRARKIAKLYPEVLSIYDLGAEIQQIEAESLHQAERGNLSAVLALAPVITRLKALIPTRP